MPARQDAQRGVSAIVFLVTLVLTLGGLLAVIDLARIQLAQGRLQSALDSAVEAATRRFGSAPGGEWEREINAWMQANHDVPFRLTVNRNQDRLSATADHNLPLLSAGFLSFDSTTATVQAASGTFLSSGRRLEVVVALDASISETWLGGLLDARPMAAREAARDLIRALLPETPDPDIRVGLVPFADTIKIVDPASSSRDAADAISAWMRGDLRAGVPDWSSWLSYWGHRPNTDSNPWTGCLTERNLDTAGKETALPESLVMGPGSPRHLAPLFLPYKFPLTPSLDRQSWRLISAPTPVVDLRYGVAANVAGTRELDVWLSLPAPNCARVPAMTHLTPNRNAFDAGFNRMLALPLSGNNASLLPLGLLWAWRMLEPSWRTGIWTDAGNTTSQTEKVIVLVSTGLNRPQMGSLAYSGRSFGVPFMVDYSFSYNECVAWFIVCLRYEQRNDIARFSSDGITGNPVARATDKIAVNANTLTSLNAYGTTLYRNAGRDVRQSDASDLVQYTQALCRRISGTDIKLYTLTVQPHLLPRVTLPCDAHEHAAEIRSWSSSTDRSREVNDLANRILEAYQNPR